MKPEVARGGHIGVTTCQVAPIDRHMLNGKENPRYDCQSRYSQVSSATLEWRIWNISDWLHKIPMLR